MRNKRKRKNEDYINWGLVLMTIIRNNAKGAAQAICIFFGVVLIALTVSIAFSYASILAMFLISFTSVFVWLLISGLLIEYVDENYAEWKRISQEHAKKQQDN
jgi:CHASE2 domain-containing sensor protein